MSNEQPTPQLGIPLLQAIQLPDKGAIQVQFSLNVTDQLQCMLSVGTALVQMAQQALAQERAERRPVGQQRILRAPPGARVPKVD